MSQSLGETARNALGSLKRGLNAFLGKGNGDAAPDAGDVPTGEAGVASEPAAAANLGGASPSANAPGTQLQFSAQGPQWGFASWQLSEADRLGLAQSGASSLSLRIADVTGLSGDAAASPHAQQEVSVERSASQWGMALPLADRDYRVDLGYHSPGGWVLLARSGVVTIPGLGDGLSVPPPFAAFDQPGSAPAPAAWQAPASAAGQPPVEAPGAVLHEQLYQTATMGLRRIGRGSETFHELDLLDDAAGARASHGGMSDSATLKIGEEVVPLSADGTFRVQVPFRDGQQLYPIEATAIDGEQKRNIVLRFERTTPEDNTNPADEAKAEWF